ncbi:MAG: alternative ribosome rescue aminoacyl-tRNA hydrolase ArfB [Myxococcota bacterium]
MALRAPRRELEFRFIRSSGPGGQNVNKVASKAVLRWDVANSRALPPAVLARFRTRFARRLGGDGVLIITSQRHRTRERNVAECGAKLEAMLAEVAKPPKRRKPTRPTRASKERRLAAKRAVSQRKAERRRRDD